MRVEISLRFENDEPGNTWFSNNDGEEAKDGQYVQLHLSNELYVALGKPGQLRVSFEPVGWVE